MVDAHHTGTGDRAGESHNAGTGGEYHLIRYPGQVHAPVPGQPRLGW
jgi:hypothetical protein